MKCKRRYLAVCILFALLLSSCSKADQNEVLEVTDLSNGGIYCYQGIKWGSSTEEVAETIKCSLGKTVWGYETPNGIYSDVRNVQMYGMNGVEVYGFEERGLRFVRVSFGELSGRSNLDDFFDQLLGDLKETYGPTKEQKMGKCFFRSGEYGTSSYYEWETVSEDGSKNILQLHFSSDYENIIRVAQLYLENVPA